MLVVLAHRPHLEEQEALTRCFPDIVTSYEVGPVAIFCFTEKEMAEISISQLVAEMAFEARGACL